jgi:hypothetical protein
LAAAATLAAPAIGLAQTTATWIGAVDGSWNVASNWNAGPGLGYPGQGGAAILPNPQPSQNFDINITLPTGFGTTISSISFLENGNFGYSVIGAGSVTIGATAGVNGTLTVNAGGTGSITASVASAANSNLFKTGGGTLILSGTNAFGTATGLQVGGGVLQANASASLTGLTAITTAGDGQFILNNASITGAAFGGLGSNPTGGAVRSVAGNNTWNGSWFVVAPTSVGVDAGSLTLTGVVFDSTQTSANGFTKTGAGTFTAAQLALNGPLSVSQGTVRLADNGTAAATSHTGNLTIAGGATPTAKLDVRDNDLIVDYTGASPLTTIKGQIKAAYNGGAWNGNGLTTTLGGPILAGPFTGKNAALGYAEATALGSPASFNGYSIDNTTLLVKYTFQADADLDGDVDGNDVTRWALNFTGDLGGAGTKVWTEGDWDYDGDVDGNDVTRWALNFSGDLGGGGLGPVFLPENVSLTAATILQDLGVNVTVVPEPSCLALVGLAGLGLTSRRRRRDA